ncbi:hypothetical protein [Mesobacillus thioparans]|uniref:hypothetical protein n=1 Tax=Mesobacillus thioparans TaxID=370439 RepID=UPI0039F040FB
MSEENRERLKLKEEQKNPGAVMNNAWARAVTGSPGSGCLVNMISVLMVLGVILLIRACSQ